MNWQHKLGLYELQLTKDAHTQSQLRCEARVRAILRRALY